MSDGDMLLAAILANPEEDTPRLAYADEIQDADPDRAEFIRVQCELARLSPGACCRASWMGRCDGSNCDHCRLPHLRHRERHLREVNAFRWFSLPGLAAASVWSASPTVRWRSEADHGEHDFIGGDTARGFVSHLLASCGDFVRHAAVMFRSHPISTARLEDRVPIDGSAWTRGGATSRPRGGPLRPRRLTSDQIERAAIPSGIFSLMPGVTPHMNWRDFEDPWAALSVGCVAWARAAARVRFPSAA